MHTNTVKNLRVSKLLNKAVTALFTAILFLGILPTNAFAKSADFVITTDYDLIYQTGENFVTVNEKFFITVNNPYYYYPAQERKFTLPDFSLQSSSEERQFKKDSLTIKDKNGTSVVYKIEDSENGIIIKTNEKKVIDKKNSYSINITYKTHELVDKSGNVSNLYIPGLEKDTKFTETDSDKLVTNYVYNTRVLLPTNAPDASYVQPKSITKSKDSEHTIYSIPQESRVDNTGWIQIGSDQFYYFKIVQEAPKTDTFTPDSLSNISDLVSTNIYKLVLPREYDETTQQVFFKNINPKPSKVERDSENNLIATFEVPANKSSQIEIEGYITMKKTLESGNNRTLPDMTSDQFIAKASEMDNYIQYTKADKYWETKDPEIKKVADDLISNNKSFPELIKADYRFVVDRLSYDQKKAGENNIRYGAKGALDGKPAVCMEYSDLLIAILRAQGIPARAAYGYGNDPNQDGSNLTTQLVEQKVGHQWVQIWIPQQGWFSLDPTWGETKREYIGADLDHILWLTASSNENKAPDSALYSADILNKSSFESYKLYLKALPKDEFAKETNLKNFNDFMNDYSDKGTSDNFSFWIKTTIFGRMLVILAPSCFTISIVLIVSLIIIRAVIKLVKKKKSTATEPNI